MLLAAVIDADVVDVDVVVVVVVVATATSPKQSSRIVGVPHNLHRVCVDVCAAAAALITTSSDEHHTILRGNILSLSLFSLLFEEWMGAICVFLG